MAIHLKIDTHCKTDLILTNPSRNVMYGYTKVKVKLKFSTEEVVMQFE